MFGASVSGGGDLTWREEIDLVLGSVLSGLDALEPNKTEHSILWTIPDSDYIPIVDPKTLEQEPKPPQDAYKSLTAYMATQNLVIVSSGKMSGIDQCVEAAVEKLKEESGKKSIVILTDNRDCTRYERCTYTKEFQSVGNKTGDLKEKGIQLLV